MRGITPSAPSAAPAPPPLDLARPTAPRAPCRDYRPRLASSSNLSHRALPCGPYRLFRQSPLPLAGWRAALVATSSAKGDDMSHE